MNHSSNDDLLELVLGGGEGNRAVDEHVRECLECSLRLGEVRQEQDLLKGAFHLAPASDTLRRKVMRRPILRRLTAAAAIFLIVAAGAVVLRSATLSPHRGEGKRSPVALERMHRKLYAVVQRLEDTRESLVKPVDEQKSQAFVQLLSEEENLYADSLEEVLDQVSPVSPGQSAQLRTAIHEFSGLAWQHENAARLAAEFRSRLRTLLNDPQYHAFEEYSVAEREWDRESDIDRFTTDLARHFDLRYSESQRVRETLEAQYLSEDLPMVCLALYVTDRLLENPPLTVAVRNALDPEHRGSLDLFVQGLRQTRDEADRIARRYSQSH
jgi:hypothetical protein